MLVGWLCGKDSNVWTRSTGFLVTDSPLDVGSYYHMSSSANNRGQFIKEIWNDSGFCCGILWHPTEFFVCSNCGKTAVFSKMISENAFGSCLSFALLLPLAANICSDRMSKSQAALSAWLLPQFLSRLSLVDSLYSQAGIPISCLNVLVL